MKFNMALDHFWNTSPLCAKSDFFSVILFHSRAASSLLSVKLGGEGLDDFNRKVKELEGNQ